MDRDRLIYALSEAGPLCALFYAGTPNAPRINPRSDEESALLYLSIYMYI